MSPHLAPWFPLFRWGGGPIEIIEGSVFGCYFSAFGRVWVPLLPLFGWEFPTSADTSSQWESGHVVSVFDGDPKNHETAERSTLRFDKSAASCSSREKQKAHQAKHASPVLSLPKCVEWLLLGHILHLCLLRFSG